MLTNLPDRVRIVEVGPRDGLQNEPQPLAIAAKVTLIRDLVEAGAGHIEIGAFVSPEWVPQMAGSAEVAADLGRVEGVRFSALVPNERGLDAAIAAGVDEIAVFTAASETFAQKNINCSIDESLERFKPVIRRAGSAGIRARGYVSCTVGCPYEGPVAPSSATEVAARLMALGCDEVSLGDTIGIGTPATIVAMLQAVTRDVPIERLALHPHDTYGQALANVLAALDFGIRVFDSSVAGLGGCPYAPGASGNLATEELVYMLRGMGIETGIDLDKLVRAGEGICHALGRDNRSRVARALIARH